MTKTSKKEKSSTSSDDFSLTVIVPVFNEAATVERSLERLLQQPEISAVIVVNDGSTDQTRSILQTFDDPRLQILHQPNGGKGAAIRTALERVTTPYLVIHDADLEYDPHDLELLLEPLRRGKAQVVYGSRFLGPYSERVFGQRVGNKLLNSLVNLLYQADLSDMETCYKVLPTALMRSLELESADFKIEPEITCKLLQRGRSIHEVPISYEGRNYAAGKKLSWTDGMAAVGYILSHRFQSS